MIDISLERAARNPMADRVLPALPFKKDGIDVVRKTVCGWAGYEPSPLRDLSDLASELNVGKIYFKDESTRFGLNSFKPLGGAFAVSRVLARYLASETGVDNPDLSSGMARERMASLTVTAATDGNHGRSVAWGARKYGCRCVIFVCASVSQQRKNAIAAYGAEIRVVDGSFDDAVRKAASTALEEGWFVIPDTSDGSIIDAPRDVTQGYMLMVDEALEQLKDEPPVSHVFLQAGVGGMASASAARFWQAYGEKRPLTILVEPNQCACWYESLVAGEPVAVTGDVDSAMAGLACGEVSLIAWPVLATGADFMVTLNDNAVPVMMRYLAEQGTDDRPVVAGETGISGLAGLVAAAQDNSLRKQMGLGPESRIFVINSEGDTDPEAYKAIVGKSANEVIGR
ncbi:diaminopropionate ammonia-lyase [Cohaesibacter celericrescens]|uniref:Diaminopropionate ammonia-lyase n=1 Tax=Cohaesibacter celericrescens TaxID=2067669 RepID=A0A2N5XVN1_9HYPH|nr:diaminopropionate ammonia-lyase [Cohaesibacter celericrescens]PLW78566.1 diaminopropionate ammonia-lyase [Cohaesibacter celericrescens]